MIKYFHEARLAKLSVKAQRSIVTPALFNSVSTVIMMMMMMMMMMIVTPVLFNSVSTVIMIIMNDDHQQCHIINNENNATI